jgi:hypothetical protein
MRLMEWEVYKMNSSSPNYEIDQRGRCQLGKHLKVTIQTDLQIGLFANREGQKCAEFSKEWLFIECRVR